MFQMCNTQRQTRHNGGWEYRTLKIAFSRALTVPTFTFLRVFKEIILNYGGSKRNFFTDSLTAEQLQLMWSMQLDHQRCI